jgi:glycosyltransferase involved in cell wall biosynthesis
VVSTTLGCVGIQGENGKDLLITDTADAMAAALENVLSDKQLYTSLQQNAAHLIRNKYSQSVVSATRNEVYHQLMKDK